MWTRSLICGLFVVALFGCREPRGGNGPQRSISSTQLKENVDEMSLDAFIRGSQYPELADAIAHMPLSDDRKSFAGILASHQGRNQESIELLSRRCYELYSRGMK
jgi:hypothetical protein